MNTSLILPWFSDTINNGCFQFGAAFVISISVGYLVVARLNFQSGINFELALVSLFSDSR